MEDLSASQLSRSQSSRRSLHRRTPSLSQYQTTPITKHYDINDQILLAFESSYEQKVYQVAYALGLQFVETALLEIPKHGYFYSRRHERERMQSALDAVRVSRLLLEMQENEKDKLDLDDSDRKRVDSLNALALGQVEEASNDQTYESHRAKTEKELRDSQDDQKEWVVCEPLLVCTDSLADLMLSSYSGAKIAPSEEAKPVAANKTDHTKTHHKRGKILRESLTIQDVAVEPEVTTVSKPPPLHSPGASRMSSDTFGRARTAPAWVPDQWKPAISSGSMTSSDSFRSVPQPPPLVSAPGLNEPLSSRQQHSSMMDTATMPYDEYTSLSRKISSEDQLERALYLSGLEVSSKDWGDDQDGRVPPPDDSEMLASSRLELKFYSEFFREDFEALCKSGRIRVSFVETYQGRLPESTNGCTVIAPLLCIHHLLDHQMPDPGLPDAIIQQVIDEETPAILTELRRELGLSDQAFLIPSDAHDSLIKNGQLSQQQFVTVVGGNILDDKHLLAFLDVLRDDGGKHRKLGATLFFHEHVVAILKVRRGKKECWYDLIDGLPLKKTLVRSEESDVEFHHRLGLTESKKEISDAFLPMTARLRCLDWEALMACLRWYACSKFSDENISYIDQYAWDEASCDFDPRVFQGFVWSEAPLD